MLPKKFRLRVLEFYKHQGKQKKQNSPIGVFFVKEEKSVPSKFAIYVPGRLDKRAVVRHKTKRILIEAVRDCLDIFKNNYWVLIKASRILEKKDRKSVFGEIKRSFKEAGLLNEVIN